MNLVFLWDKLLIKMWNKVKAVRSIDITAFFLFNKATKEW